MTLPTPTPPEWLIEAVYDGDLHLDLTRKQRDRITAAVWDALLAEGGLALWMPGESYDQREPGTPFPFGYTYAGEDFPVMRPEFRHVLVVPLARHNPNQATT